MNYLYGLFALFTMLHGANALTIVVGDIHINTETCTEGNQDASIVIGQPETCLIARTAQSVFAEANCADSQLSFYAVATCSATLSLQTVALNQCLRNEVVGGGILSYTRCIDVPAELVFVKEFFNSLGCTGQASPRMIGDTGMLGMCTQAAQLESETEDDNSLFSAGYRFIATLEGFDNLSFQTFSTSQCSGNSTDVLNFTLDQCYPTTDGRSFQYTMMSSMPSETSPPVSSPVPALPQGIEELIKEVFETTDCSGDVSPPTVTNMGALETCIKQTIQTNIQMPGIGLSIPHISLAFTASLQGANVVMTGFTTPGCLGQGIRLDSYAVGQCYTLGGSQSFRFRVDAMPSDQPQVQEDEVIVQDLQAVIELPRCGRIKNMVRCKATNGCLWKAGQELCRRL